MAKRIIYKYSAIVLLIVVSTAGCDVFNSDNDDATNREPFFNFEVQDENGEVLTTASDDQLNGKEIETGVGLFGEEFTSPRLIEQFQERTEFELSPEAFRQKRIFLHAEEGEGIGDSVRYASVNFAFSRLDEWQEGRFEIRGFSKEERLAILRRSFEHFQRTPTPPDSADGQASHDTLFVITGADTVSIDSTSGIFHNFDPDETVHMNYFESDGSRFPEYLFMPVEGFIELENVTEDRISGSFEVSIGGLRAISFSGEVFPEDPEFRTFNIHGNFTARHGNYEDLARLRAQRIKQLIGNISGGPVFFF